MEQDDFLGGGGDDFVGGRGTGDNAGSLFPSDAAAVPPTALSTSAVGGSVPAEGAASGTAGGMGAEGKQDSSKPSEKAGGSSAMLEFDDDEFDAVGVAGAAAATAVAGPENTPGAALEKKAEAPVGAGGDGPSKPEAAGSLNDELSQLEELERELGIMGVVGDSGGAGGGGGGGGGSAATATATDGGKDDDNFDMDNLDELEGYLESLAK